MAIARSIETVTHRPGGVPLPAPPDLSREESDRDLRVARVAMGVDPQEVLDKYAAAQDRAAEIREDISAKSAQLKDLKAYYYGNGSNPSHYERERKEILSGCIVSIATSASKPDGVGRMTDKLLDAMAHQHPDYRKHLERGRADARVMANLQEDLDSLYRRLETALGAIEYYAKAWKSCDSLLYFATQNRRNGA